MPLSREQVAEAVRAVWAAAVGLEVRPAGPATLPPTVRGCRTGSVQVSGGWAGAVRLAVADPLARRAAAALFRLPPDAVYEADMRNAVGVLADRTADRLTALLPGPSRRGPAEVAAGSDQAVRGPAGRPLVRVPFVCDGQPLAVAVSEAEPADSWADLPPG